MPNPPTVAGAVANLVFTSLRSLLILSPFGVNNHQLSYVDPMTKINICDNTNLDLATTFVVTFEESDEVHTAVIKGMKCDLTSL